MPRPYVSSSVDELEALFDKQGEDPYVLTQLLVELGHRHTKKARRLLSRVAERLADFEPEEETPEDVLGNASDNNFGEPGPSDRLAQASHGSGRSGPAQVNGMGLFGRDAQDFERPPNDLKRPAQLSRMRPPGTAGLPNPWVRPLAQDISLGLPEDSDFVDLYVAALGALIAEIKRTGAGQKRYELENGVRVDSLAGGTLYSFPFAEEADLFEDAQIEVEIPGQRIDGSVVSISSGRLLLALNEDLGLKVDKAILLVDATALLEALKEKIEQVKNGELTINRDLADAVIGQTDPPTDLSPISAIPPKELNPAQQKAFDRSLTEAISYIWGPPGCGKTKTLGEIVRAAFEGEKRVLVCSNTNKAVDQVLYRICKALGVEHPAMENGRVVRVGRIVDDKLEANYAAYVTVDGIVERRSAELEARKREIEEEIERIDARTARARQLLERFEELDRAEKTLAALRDTTNEAAREGKRLLADVEAINASLNGLENELRERVQARFGLFKRSAAVIRRDIEMNQTHRQTHLKEIDVFKVRYSKVRQKYEAAVADRDERRSRLEGQDRVGAEQGLTKAKEARDPLVAELREIEVKISQIREEILREARVLGATCTKSYLSAKEIGQVDMVIIDEASMVNLPMIWFTAGLARERVVVCGDFRQIPPIVQTNQQAIFDVLGHDVFTQVGLVNAPDDDARLVLLDTQYRMEDAICELISEPMYQNLLRTDKERGGNGKRALPDLFDGTLTIVDTSDLWPFESVNAFYSRFNLMHALLARNLAWHFWRKGCVESGSDLGICTPYAAQAKLIRKLLEGEQLDNLVQVGTVHSFQGDERRTIVIEIPESHGGGKMLGQFIQGVPPEHVGARLINVAVSRAKDHLIVLANLTHLDRLLPSSSLLRDILYETQEHGRGISGKELLELRPIQSDLKGLFGRIDLEIEAEKFGIFNESTCDPAVKADIENAKESVVIFSGFVTPRRVAELGDLLRAKVADGVRVRCVTRPPKLNGTMDPALGKEALDMLEGIGCTVDCRARIHEKVVLIDKMIVWHGSLNVLSHSHHTDESMTRLVNVGYAQSIAANMSKLRVSGEKAVKTVANAENPRCPVCGSRTVYSDGKFGPFFYCEECDWRENLAKVERGSRGRSNTTRQSGLPEDGPPCPNCGKKTKVRSGRYGMFYGCVDYPKCKGTVKASESSKKRPGKKATGARRRRKRKTA